MSKQPTVDIEDAVKDMTDEALECRDFSHSWRPFSASRESYGFERTLQCRNCKTERRETLDKRGGLVSRSYAYPEGFLIKGLGRLSGNRKDAVRLASMLRAIPDKTSVKEITKAKSARKKKIAA